MRKIKIGNKEYNIDFNAYTYLLYRQIFNMNIFDDILTIRLYFAKQEKLAEEIETGKLEIEITLDEIEDFLISISKLCYIGIYSAENENFIEYKDFMKEIPKLTVDEDWVIEVTGLAVEKFC